MHHMHVWLTVQMLWLMHGRTLQAVHNLVVCMRTFYSDGTSLSGDCTGWCTYDRRLFIVCMHMSAHIVSVHHSVTTHSW